MKKMMRRKPAKDARDRLLLLGLVELYLQTGRPIGSSTLREHGFESFSTATIRNYFVRLEEAGYLKQQHTSGGRVPTQQAYKAYAEAVAQETALEEKDRQRIQERLGQAGRDVVRLLQEAVDLMSSMTNCAVFLSAPRFDQDFVTDVRITPIDSHRCLCVLITDFGVIKTELFHLEQRMGNIALKRVEAYVSAKLHKQAKPLLSPDEERLAEKLYSEVMLRYISAHANFRSEDIYKTGFSHLLGYPDFQNPSALAEGLALFENAHYLRELLGECCKERALCCWIGEDLVHLGFPPRSVVSYATIAVPYKVNQTVVGAVALLGPQRIPYRRLLGMMQYAADTISATLTKSLYKFQISYRKPHPEGIDLHTVVPSALPIEGHQVLLEDRSKSYALCKETSA